MTNGIPPRERTRQQALLWIVIAATVWRWALATLTPVPSEDGVSYLWMAQRFAAGDFAGGLDAVFPPGLALLVAPLLKSGLEPRLAAQLIGCVCGGLCVLPVAFAAERMRPGALLPAAMLFASGSLLCRNAAEVYSEPPFLLLMALGVVAGLRHQYWRVGLCAGLGFLFRPEALLLSAAFALCEWRAAWRALLPTVAGVLALALLRASSGHGFDPLPILGFHALRDDLPERGDVLANLIAVPWAYVEAFGPTALLPLLLASPRRQPRPDGARALTLQVLLDALAICTFVVRRRFFLSAAAPVVVLAGVGVCRLRPWLRAGALALCVGFGLVSGYTGLISTDRVAEAGVGRYLGRLLHEGETLTTDLPRVAWYANRRPPPPRHFSSVQMLRMVAPANVRYVVLSRDGNRGSYETVAASLVRDFAPLQLPVELQEPADRRGIAVFVRR